MSFQNLSQEKVTIILPNTHSQDVEPTKTTGPLSMTGNYYIRKAGVNYYKFHFTRGSATLESLADVPDGGEFQACFRLN